MPSYSIAPFSGVVIFVPDVSLNGAVVAAVVPAFRCKNPVGAIPTPIFPSKFAFSSTSRVPKNELADPDFEKLIDPVPFETKFKPIFVSVPALENIKGLDAAEGVIVK